MLISDKDKNNNKIKKIKMVANDLQIAINEKGNMGKVALPIILYSHLPLRSKNFTEMVRL